MPDRITELNALIKNAQAELKKQEEYTELLKKIQNGKPSFEEFCEFAVKFVSQFEKEIPHDRGTIDNIKLYYLYGAWKVRFNLKCAHGTIYDIDADKMNVDEMIAEHIKEKRQQMQIKIGLLVEDKNVIEEQIKELENEVKALGIISGGENGK